MVQGSSKQMRNTHTVPQLIPDDVIGDLVVQAQQLTCSILELELEENLENAVMAGTTKLIVKVLSKHQIQKFQVLNAVNKA